MEEEEVCAAGLPMLRRMRSSDYGVFGDAAEFEIEGDGPLGIVFRKSGEGIAIRSVVRETVAAETQGLLDGMLLLAVEGLSKVSGVIFANIPLFWILIS
eukprot:COSAG03_NODE_6109_length_1115_cov_6.778543_1_plen_99_part_00